MDAKRCSTCRSVLPLDAFNLRAAAPDGHQARCRSCARAWYDANRLTHRANVQARNTRVRAENRQRLAQYLIDHPCVDCGERDVRTLEFDHEDPEQKRDDVTRLLACGLSWERILEEIAKCAVRCANCHRRRTAERGQFWRQRVELERREQQVAAASARLARL